MSERAWSKCADDDDDCDGGRAIIRGVSAAAARDVAASMAEAAERTAAAVGSCGDDDDDVRRGEDECGNAGARYGGMVSAGGVASTRMGSLARLGVTPKRAVFVTCLSLLLVYSVIFLRTIVEFARELSDNEEFLTTVREILTKRWCVATNSTDRPRERRF